MTHSGSHTSRIGKGLATLAAGAVLAATVTAPAFAAPQPSAPPSDVGFQSIALATVSGTSIPIAPTAPKTEHKLWYAGGQWWASMARASGGFSIHRLDNRDATPSWTDTGPAIDVRNGTSADALYNPTANKLFVASHVVTARSTAAGTERATLSRFTLTSGVWALDSGWPITVVNRSLPSLAIAQESDGQIIAAFADNARPYVIATKTSANLATPIAFGPAKFLVQWNGAGHNLFGLDLTKSTTLDGDDLVAISSAGAYTTVMWSNQSKADAGANQGFYVARHKVSDPYGTGNFYGSEVTGSAVLSSDNHISLLTAPTGVAYAAVKTSYDLKPTVDPADAQLELVRLTPRPGGTGLQNSGYVDSVLTTLTTVGDGGTRPVISLDTSSQKLNVLFSAPESGPDLAADPGKVAGVIFRKQVKISDLSVTPGTPRGIETLYHVGSTGSVNKTRDGLNDATVSASPTTSASGLVILATSSVVTSTPTTVTTRRNYWFNDIFRAPVAGFSQLPTSPDALTVDFTDRTTSHPTNWSWNFGDGSPTSKLQNPTHVFPGAGPFTVTLAVNNEWGPDSASSTVSVGAVPIASFTIARISPAVIGLRFKDTSTRLPAAITWNFGDGSAIVNALPGSTVAHVYKVARAYRVTMTATNGLGTATSTKIFTTATINARPATPGRPGAKAVSGRKALLTWRAPVANGLVITSYRVRVISGGRVVRLVSFRGTVRSGYVIRLVKGKRYVFTIQAVNRLGASRWSLGSRVITAKI